MSNLLNIQAIYDYAKLSTFAYVDLSYYSRDSLTIPDIINEMGDLGRDRDGRRID